MIILLLRLGLAAVVCLGLLCIAIGIVVSAESAIAGVGWTTFGIVSIGVAGIWEVSCKLAEIRDLMHEDRMRKIKEYEDAQKSEMIRLVTGVQRQPQMK